MSGLISAKTGGVSGSLVSGLTAKARQIAVTHSENRLLSQARDGRRWRNARLLWPLASGD